MLMFNFGYHKPADPHSLCQCPQFQDIRILNFKKIECLMVLILINQNKQSLLENAQIKIIIH